MKKPNPTPFWKESSLKAVWNRANEGAKHAIYFSGFALFVISFFFFLCIIAERA